MIDLGRVTEREAAAIVAALRSRNEHELAGALDRRVVLALSTGAGATYRDNAPDGLRLATYNVHASPPVHA